MNKVYGVEIVVEEEYGNRETVAVCPTKELAQKLIDKLGNETVECWFGNIDLYTIEEYDILLNDKDIEDYTKEEDE